MKKRLLLLLAAVLLLLTGCSRKGSEAWLRRMGEDSGYENAFSQLTTLSETTLDGHTFLRCQQYYEGIPVWKRHVICLTDENGDVLTVTGNPLDVDENLSLTPTAAPEQVRLTAQPYLGSEEFTMPGEDELYIYNLGSDGKSHLAYHISAPTYDLLIDAHTGLLLKAVPTFFSDEIAKLSLDGQKDQVYDEVSVSFKNNVYRLYDSARNITVFFTNETPEGVDENRAKYENNEILDHYYCEWSDKAELKQYSTYLAWADAYVNTQIAYDYFSSELSHTSPDRKGGTEIRVLVVDRYISDVMSMNLRGAHSSDRSTNATDLTFFSNADNLNYSYYLEVVAHEYAHAVEQMNVGMIYAGESGAIMEGLSDLFGELACAWYEKKGPDWVHGERKIRSPLDNGYPSVYLGSHWGDTSDFSKEGDNGHVHQNSTVISHAAYLMSVDGGGSLTLDELQELWYRAIYMMNPDSDFTHCRTSVEWAALTMNLSPEKYQCISKAFDAVKIPASSVQLAPGGEITVLDRQGVPYSDYTCSIYELDLDAILSRDVDQLECVYIGEPASEVLPTQKLKPGYYYVALMDNQNRSRKETFDLTVWPGGPEEYDVQTHFGPFRLSGTVTDGDQPLSGVSVKVEGTDAPPVSTDENGGFTLNHDPSIRDLRLVFQKEGYQEETLTITLTPLDLAAGVHETSPVVLKPEIHPYAQVIRDYETTYGAIGCHNWGYSTYSLTGVIYLDLLDFDSDGTQELVMGYCDGGSDYTNYRLTVWTLQDDTAVLLYDRPSTHGSDISRWFELVQVDGVWHVGTGYTGYEDDLRYYALQKGEFEQVMHLTREIIDEYYYVSVSQFNGITITIPEYGAHYKTWHTNAEKIDCILSASDPETELNALRQQIRDIYKQLGMAD